MSPRSVSQFSRWLAVLMILGLLATAQAAAKPNIVFILADDLGYGDLGCYGQKLISTPVLDQMAAEGMRFTQFYAGAPVCAPSRSVLMTGLHMGHTRVRGNAGQKNPLAQQLRAEDVTVAKLLKQAGYTTGLVGKWGLGLPNTPGHPNKQGFDYFFGFLDQVHAHNHYPEFLWRNNEKVMLGNVVTPVGPNGGGYASKRVAYADDLFVDEAVKFVEQNKRGPFFLYLAFTVPHANNEATRELGDGQEVPEYGAYKDRDWTTPNKGQAAMISRMDAGIGRVLAKLKELNLEQNTLVIFTSDNGPHREGGNSPEFFDANGPVRGIKRDLYDGGVRIPFIARWPGKVKPGIVSKHVGSFADFLPSAAELAGVKFDGSTDGLSILPTLFGQDAKQKEHNGLYWEFHERGFSQAALLDGHWKGVRLGRDDAPLEVFDLNNDLGENHDVAAEHPEIVARLEAYLKAARTATPDWPIINRPLKDKPKLP